MSNQPPTAPAPTSSSSRITEIHIRWPNEYDGKAETAQAWLDSIHLYLLINQALYHDDDRKIAYTLSYMKKGSAATWAEVCRQQGFANQSFRTLVAFETDFEKAFGNANIQQEAMNWLTTTRIATGEQLQEYINQFKLNIVHAKCDKVKDAATLVSYFLTGIPIGIMQWVQAMDNVPTTIIGWYEKAAHFHLQREIAQKIALMHWGPTPQNTHPNFTHRPRHHDQLMIQTPWILTPWISPWLKGAAASEIIFALSANSQTVPRETTPEKRLPPVPLAMLKGPERLPLHPLSQILENT